MELENYSRKYRTNYKEVVLKIDDAKELVEVEKEEDERNFEMEYTGDTLKINYEKTGEDSIIKKIDSIFEELVFSLDLNKNIDKLISIETINQKFEEVRSDLFQRELAPDEEDLIYKFSSLLENNNNLADIYKEYYLFKYLFLGIYELSDTKKNIEKELEVKKIFLTDMLFDIKMKYDEEENEIEIKGKDSLKFGAVNYVIKLIKNGYLKERMNGGLSVSLKGKYILNEDKSIKKGFLEIVVKYQKVAYMAEGDIFLEIRHLFNIEEVE